MGLLIEPYKNDTSRQHTLAHCGADYLNAVGTLLRAQQIDFRAFHPFVGLPLLHMAIELLAKAHAVRVEPSIDLHKFSHHTAKLIKKKRAAIPVFADIAADGASLALILALEKAWTAVRYGEALTMDEGDVFPRGISIADRLGDAHFEETGVHLFDRHFAGASGELVSDGGQAGGLAAGPRESQQRRGS